MDTQAAISAGSRDTHLHVMRLLLAQLSLVNEAFVGREVAQQYTRQMELALGHVIDEFYRDVLGLREPLSRADVLRLLTAVKERLEGTCTVECADDREIVLVSRTCPWAEMTAHLPGLCREVAGIYGVLAARHFGAARVLHDERSRAGGHCRLRLLLQPDPHMTAGESYTREEALTLPGPLPTALLRPMLRRHQQELAALEADYDLLTRREDELSERQSEAQQAELAALAQKRLYTELTQSFLINVPHELRTPVTVIQGYLDMLGQGQLGELTTDQDAAVKTSREHLDRLNRLIDGLLDYTRATHDAFCLPREPVAVDVLVAESVDRASLRALRRGVTLRQRLSPALGRLYGNREKLVEVVEHLLENAIKYSEPGQAVTLSVFRRCARVVIRVRDRGIGMTQEQLDYACMPFAQGESGLCRRYGGLGMGLSLIRNLVKLHDGTMSIRSAVNKGTTVTISLPAMG